MHTGQTVDFRVAPELIFGRLTMCAPGGAMLYDPVEERLLKTNIMASLFAFDPFMTEDLFALRFEFSVKR